MTNPIKAVQNYLAAKSIKQRIYLVIIFSLLIVFVVFFIKGNLFDDKVKAEINSVSQISDSSENNSENNSEMSEQKELNEPQFKISFIDLGILLIVIVLFVIHKIRDKLKHRGL